MIPNQTALWKDFSLRQDLNEQQLADFKWYADFLKSHNEQVNLTAITELSEIIWYHFDDSLILDKADDIHSIHTIADIGTGAGFPGLPLKIKYPHLKLILLEVNQKKINFLYEVIEKLKLEDVVVIDTDWRTFLRTTAFSIDFFCARASLQPAELIRLFSPTSFYKNAKLCYWASKNWLPEEKLNQYIIKFYDYEVGQKKRKLIFFQ